MTSTTRSSAGIETYEDVLDPLPVGEPGDVLDVVEVYEGLVVGVGDAGALLPLGHGDDLLRRGVLGSEVLRLGHGQVPVLAPGAGEAAPDAADGKGEAAGVEVGEGLLLDGVDGDGGELAVGEADETAVLVLLRVAEAPLTGPYHAHPGADDAPYCLLPERFREP
jgi:hypothetical protein